MLLFLFSPISITIDSIIAEGSSGRPMVRANGSVPDSGKYNSSRLLYFCSLGCDSLRNL